jgi:hypothetical protein
VEENWVGIVALLFAIALLIWGIVSLGSDKKKDKSQDDDDDDWDDMMMFGLD